jgi:hypothetical protein
MDAGRPAQSWIIAESTNFVNTNRHPKRGFLKISPVLGAFRHSADCPNSAREEIGGRARFFPAFSCRKGPRRPSVSDFVAYTQVGKSLAEFAPAGANKVFIVFSGGLYVGKNSLQPASVESVRHWRADYARLSVKKGRSLF